MDNISYHHVMTNMACVLSDLSEMGMGFEDSDLAFELESHLVHMLVYTGCELTNEFMTKPLCLRSSYYLEHLELFEHAILEVDWTNFQPMVKRAIS